jgi:hypothetical protein
MTTHLIYTSNDDYYKLVALLDERRRMVKRHALAKKKPSRRQMTLAEKLTADRQNKDELAEMNRRIGELTQSTGGSNHE